ncbi:Gfo/Idh/MocA family protein [Streptomyces spectabilis]|uniref:Gfo/Idh/MocA family oxidoreductase n=1 Tax=Streptomyces spectabilis TaxID=68270 RepID=A0A5P2XJ35_STRST|nr:Gfo/Idh/MocA family oxidoreductase [Streptomyces spectabilis]MBB5107112.1 putative dehydrogenase [Streptomyces spectabilis]MCI3906160.1 Gfo/Idh/MocA family oxidoreductase [Streptomyces spectabilis]QEV63040.1 gfo/Idh/MocA family oxidoreductase [Streptomyces spectabilis]GGV04508.1 NADH-dependent dehydrogenase [Streptomyces spectabilis]
MRWAVAGYGDVVERRVLPALRALGEEPVYLWGRDPDRAARVAARHGVRACGSDERALLGDEVEAVYVATPVVRHVPLARAVLAAGRPVLVEKPLAGGLEGTGGPDRGADLGGGERPPAAVAYYRRLAPAVRRLREELDGWTPARVDVRFRCAFAPGPGHPMRWRTDPAVSGGGVLADAGSHRLDLLVMLFGRPDDVRGRLTDRFPRGAERRAEVDLAWASGVRARVVAEWGDAPPVDRIEVVGEGRVLTLDPLDSGRLRTHTARGTSEVTLAPAPNPHQPLIADFVAAVAAGRPPVCPVSDARIVDEIIAAAGRPHPAWPR